MDEKLLQIFNHYGLKNQLKKLSEEVYELQEAILLDEGDYDSLDHITEELADVYVILSQFEANYEINQEKLIDIQAYKINRTLRRIEDEKSNTKNS